MFWLHATPDPVSRQSLSFGGQALFTAIGCWVKPNAGLIGSEDENSQHRFCHEPAPPRAPPALYHFAQTASRRCASLTKADGVDGSCFNRRRNAP